MRWFRSLAVLVVAGLVFTGLFGCAFFNGSPIASFEASPTTGSAPLLVQLSASSSFDPEGDSLTFAWDFGDGSNPRFDDSQIAYEYTRVGEFRATVTVKTDDGLEEVAEVIINIRPVSISGCFDTNHASGEAPLEVTFDSNCSTGTIAQYSWKINGVSTPSTPPHRLTHLFTDPGLYEVELTVRDRDGVIDTFMETINVFDGDA